MSKLNFVEEVHHAAGLDLAVRRWGKEGDEPIIALHGWMDNAATYDRIAPSLAGYCVYALDFPGHGLSSHRPVGACYNIWDYVADVVALADVLGLQKFTLMGHSLGAIVSTILAGSLPERVNKLLLIDGILPLPSKDEDFPQALARAISKRQNWLRSKSRLPHYKTLEQMTLARMDAEHSDLDMRSAQLLAERNAKPCGEGFTWRSDPRLRHPSMLRLNLAQIQAYIAGVSCPALLVLGSEGIFSTRPEFNLLQPYLKHIQQLTFEGGHHLHMEAAAPLIADAALEFLRD